MRIANPNAPIDPAAAARMAARPMKTLGQPTQAPQGYAAMDPTYRAQIGGKPSGVQPGMAPQRPMGQPQPMMQPRPMPQAQMGGPMGGQPPQMPMRGGQMDYAGLLNGMMPQRGGMGMGMGGGGRGMGGMRRPMKQFMRRQA